LSVHHVVVEHLVSVDACISFFIEDFAVLFINTGVALLLVIIIFTLAFSFFEGGFSFSSVNYRDYITRLAFILPSG
jgi:hypothetical protein